MSGFDNEVLVATGFRLEESSLQSIDLMQQVDEDVSIINRTGNPEGVYSANPSSMFHDHDNGDIYSKKTGTGNTGWALIATGSVGITVTPDEGGAIGPTSTLSALGSPSGISLTPILSTHNVTGDLIVEPRAYTTPYVVSKSTDIGSQGTYILIQDAIDAAVADGASSFARKVIRIRPDSGYTEDLTIPSGITLIADGSSTLTDNFPQVAIFGNHTMDSNPEVSFIGIHFNTNNNSLPIFDGPASFYIEECYFYNFNSTQLIATLGLYSQIKNCTFFNSNYRNAFATADSASVVFVNCQMGRQGLTNGNSSTAIFYNCVEVGPVLNSIVWGFDTTFFAGDTDNISGTTISGRLVNCGFGSEDPTTNAIATNDGFYVNNLYRIADASGPHTLYDDTCNLTPIVTGSVFKARRDSSSITGSEYDFYMGITDTSAPIGVSLPGDTVPGHVFIVNDESGGAGTNNITITPDSGKTINGASTYVINANYGCNSFIYDGTNYLTLQNPPQATSGGITTINGNSGTTSGPTVTFDAASGTAGFSFDIAADTVTLNTPYLTLGALNTFAGSGAGNGTLSGISNIGLGVNSLNGITSGNQNIGIGNNALVLADACSQNTAIGDSALTSLTGSGSDGNVAIGHGAMQAATAAIQNVALGQGALPSLLDGLSNIVIGSAAGTGYTGTESGNILLGAAGTTGESNVTRIGDTGVQTECYISGIAGVTVSNTQFVTIDSTTGQLGTDGGAFAYSTGTWSPTVFGASTAGTTTYVSQNGYYTKIGNMVFCGGSVEVASSTGTGYLCIGLPFTVKNQTGGNFRGSVDISPYTWPNSTTNLTLAPTINDTRALIYCCGNGATSDFMLLALGSTPTINFSVCYQV